MYASWPLLPLLACTGAAEAPLPPSPDAPSVAAVEPAAAAAGATVVPLPFPTAADALRHVLATNPRVLGVGEVHATTGGPGGPTTLARFTTELLPVLAPHTTDLVIETWRLDGRCGPQEEVVATKVQEDTRRPEETKSELVLLVEAAAALDVRPHDLAISCDEYAGLTGADGEIAYDALLRLLTLKLQDYALRGLDAPDATIVLYGGAVHNDLFPREALAAYSYGTAARDRSGRVDGEPGGYVELDLYAPALLAENPALVEPAWAPVLEQVRSDRVLLVERGPGSWILLLEGTPPVP